MMENEMELIRTYRNLTEENRQIFISFLLEISQGMQQTLAPSLDLIQKKSDTNE